MCVAMCVRTPNERNQTRAMLVRIGCSAQLLSSLSSWWSIVTETVRCVHIVRHIFCASLLLLSSSSSLSSFIKITRNVLFHRCTRPEQRDQSQVKWTVLLTMKFESVAIWHSHTCRSRLATDTYLKECGGHPRRIIDSKNSVINA